ncbi:MAG: DNA primase [Tepidiformaceae bacterium]
MDAVEEIKSKLDLVEYIGRVTKLHKSGRSFKGLCPFHTERTPSFHVFPERATWRCFGTCGEGGDLFTFVQKRDSLDFRDTLRVLAAEAGVQVSSEGAEKRSHREKLMAAVSASVDFYQRALQEPEAAEARAYLAEKRGLTQATVDAFRIGWAPDEWRNLRGYLSGRGYSERDMLDSGLLVEPDGGREPYDRFRGRIIIPIADERGQYVGMGGRGMHGEEPKYLNSPQTDAFDKGRTLFGLHQAIEAIRDSGTAVVVEGYMDVMGPWQAGFQNVVATMGTSLTEGHAGMLKRYAKRIVLAMDPDSAGMAAAERAGALFLSLDSPEAMARSARSADALTSATNLELRVAPLPAGKDPDEIARDDPEAWREAISGAVPYAEFLLKRLMGPATPQSPSDARQMVDKLRPVFLAVRDPIERAMYVQRVARHLGVGEEAVQERIRQGMPGRARLQAAPRAESSREDWLLALLLRYPHLRPRLRNHPSSLFGSAIGREIFERWLQDEDFFLQTSDDPVMLRARALQERRLPPLSLEDAWEAAQKNLREITRERLVQHQAASTEELAEAEKQLGANEVAALSESVWRGKMPQDERRPLAEGIMEDWQLGLSIHRRESPERG